MSLAYLVSYHIMPYSTVEVLYTYADRVFLTEEKAEQYCNKMNKGDSEGFEYLCPSEGTKEWHQYFVECIVMEEV